MRSARSKEAGLLWNCWTARVLFIRRLCSTYYATEAKGLLPEGQCRFRPHRSTTDMVIVVRGVQELEKKARGPTFPCFIGLQKAYGAVDRTLLWQVLARFGVPPQMVEEVIRQIHDEIKDCLRSDDGVCSE